MQKKLMTSTLIGNALEYYDFTIFAIFTPQLSQTFFPKNDEITNILWTLAFFAVGFLMRPIGAIIFGHLGDRFGRKKALTLSISCMAIPTFLIGILPSYGSFGIGAPILLVLLRLMQGLSIGGEGAGSAIFILEHYHKNNLGLISGMITATNFLGAFVAGIFGLLINYFAMDDLSFRAAFIFGGLLGLVGYYLRKSTMETLAFSTVLKEKRLIKIPLLSVLKENQKELFLSISLGGLCGTFAYIIIAFLPIYFNKMLESSLLEAKSYALLCLGSFILFLPLMGFLGDKHGWTSITLKGCMAVIVLIVPIFMMMGNMEWIILHYLAIILFGALAASVAACAYPIMFELFPVQKRYSGIAFGFNIGLSVFGGTAPFIATLTIYNMGTIGIIIGSAFYCSLMAGLFCFAYWITKPSPQGFELKHS